MITLTEQDYPVRKQFQGSDSIEANANDVVKFRVKNTDILDQRVPAGKKWRLYVTVKIEETDA
jgi:hypothetical protein